MIIFQWIKWLEHSLFKTLNHKLRGGGEKVRERERVVRTGEREIVTHRFLQCIELDGRRYYIDAFDPDEEICYEFQGCVHHGCCDCFPLGTEISPINGFTMRTLYQNTVKREETLRAAGYRVISMWECKLRAMLKEDSDMAAFFDECDVSCVRTVFVES